MLLHGGDYDHDGKLDFFICGDRGGVNPVSKLYHNTGNGFEDKTGVIQGLLPFYNGTAAWADWNNDGRADLLVVALALDTTLQQVVPFTRFYSSYDDSLFDVSSSELPNAPQVSNAGLSWYDYDMDGWIDLMISGNNGSAGQTWLFHNNNRKGIGFTDRTNLLPSLPPLMNTAIGWADFTNDGRPDLAITGQDISGNYYSKLYQNRQLICPIYKARPWPGVIMIMMAGPI